MAKKSDDTKPKTGRAHSRKSKLHLCRAPRGLCHAAGLLYTTMAAPRGRRRYAELRRRDLEFSARVAEVRAALDNRLAEHAATGS